VRSSRSATFGLVGALAVATVLAAPPVAAAGPDSSTASLRIEPASVAVATGSSFSVQVVQEPPVATSGAQASINFDPKILQVVSVTRGSAYQAAPIFLPENLDSDIQAANATGHLAQIAAAYTPPTAVPPGASTFLVVTFRAVACGQTDLTLPATGPFNAQMISGQQPGYGAPVPVRTINGHVTTCAAAGAITPGVSDTAAETTTAPGIPLPLLGAAVFLVAVLLAGLAGQVRRRSPSDHVAE